MTQKGWGHSWLLFPQWCHSCVRPGALLCLVRLKQQLLEWMCSLCERVKDNWGLHWCDVARRRSVCCPRAISLPTVWVSSCHWSPDWLGEGLREGQDLHSSWHAAAYAPSLCWSTCLVAKRNADNLVPRFGTWKNKKVLVFTKWFGSFMNSFSQPIR